MVGKMKKDKLNAAVMVEKKAAIQCFLCGGLHMVRGCSKRSVFSTIKGDDEPEKAMMRLGSVVHFFEAKRVRESKRNKWSASYVVVRI